MSDGRLEYAYEAARRQAAQRRSDGWKGVTVTESVSAFLAAIAERAAPEDIVALLAKVGLTAHEGKTVRVWDEMSRAWHAVGVPTPVRYPLVVSPIRRSPDYPIRETAS